MNSDTTGSREGHCKLWCIRSVALPPWPWVALTTSMAGLTLPVCDFACLSRVMGGSPEATPCPRAVLPAGVVRCTFPHDSPAVLVYE